MNLVTRYREWRIKRRAIALESSKEALVTARIKQAYLIEMGQYCIDDGCRFVANIVCDMLDKNVLKIRHLERKIRELTPK